MKSVAHIPVPQTEQDDLEFVELVSRILNGTARYYKPRDICLVQIDNWFGHNWKRFPAGLGSLVRVRWFQSLRVPPFHRNRVKSQVHFSRINSEEPLYGDEETVSLHLPYPTSEEPRYRPLHRLTDSGVFLWYSSKTNSVDRGSLMVYWIEEKDELAWYVSFLTHGEWKIEMANGISPQKVMQFASPEQHP